MLNYVNKNVLNDFILCLTEIKTQNKSKMIFFKIIEKTNLFETYNIVSFIFKFLANDQNREITNYEKFYKINYVLIGVSFFFLLKMSSTIKYMYELKI